MSPAGAWSDPLRLLDLRTEPLSPAECHDAVAAAAAGGITVFTGVVRDQDRGRLVTSLEYSAHPSALAVLREVAMRVAARHAVVGIAAVHRIGRLEVGDLAVVVAASAGHRDVAFAAARELIDELKATVPIWKRQVYADGESGWVGCDG